MNPLVHSLSVRPIHRPHRWLPGERCWVAAVALLLLTTAAMKWQALATTSLITARERVFDLPMNDWWLLAGLAEGFVVLMLAAAPSVTAALHTIRLAFLTVAGYRLLLFLHGGGDCGCLGAVSGTGLLQDQEGWILTSIALGVLGINELLLALRFARSRQLRLTSTSLSSASFASPATTQPQGGSHD